MAFGRSIENEESSGIEGGRPGGNRPDCAYFLLLGLCGAAFLLTIGGILTYIAFNPGTGDDRPHSPLSHIPHFHHHRKHHDRTEGHYFAHFEQHNYHHDEKKQEHSVHHPPQHHSSSHTTTTTPSETTTVTVSTTADTLHKPTPTMIESNNGKATGSGENGTTPGSHLAVPSRLTNGTENKMGTNSSATNASFSENKTKPENGMASNPPTSPHNQQPQDHLGLSHHNETKSNSSHHRHPPPPLDSSHHQQHQPHQQMHTPHPGVLSSVTHHREGNNSAGYEYQAKQSLALAIIGPLCLLMGIIVTLIVGVFALKYDCDHEPEPNIAFLRLRSEMSLNFDPSKNNYELLMPSSSAAAGVGSTHSIHPGGMPRC